MRERYLRPSTSIRADGGCCPREDGQARAPSFLLGWEGRVRTLIYLSLLGVARSVPVTLIFSTSGFGFIVTSLVFLVLVFLYEEICPKPPVDIFRLPAVHFLSTT